MNSQTTVTAVTLDRTFQIALLFGPVVWLALSLILEASAAPPAWQTILMVVLLYPLLEELAFRGFLQSWLLERPAFARHLVPGITHANLLTSLLFAAAHLFNQPPLWALSVFMPSLVFGFFRDRYNLVWPSVLLHCWYNAGFVWLFY